MGKLITLMTSDGVQISAYRADPAGKPKGGMVVIQEIFGVNAHMRSVADAYAAAGYVAIAPALFDRVEKNVDLEYSPESLAIGSGLVQKVDQAKTILDVEAAIKEAGTAGKVGVVGYCWGGSLAFVSSVKMPGVAAAVGYYGGNIAGMVADQPKVPLMLHFGEKDAYIPAEAVASIRKHHPEVPIYTYDAGHGFNRDKSVSFDKPSADLARERTLAFFAKHVG